MSLLVARVTLAELARRRGALALTLLLPLAFFLVRLDTHWTALRLLSMGLGWAAATLTLFTQVSARQLDRRLVVCGASPTALHAGRHLAVLALGWAVAALYTVLTALAIGDDLHRGGFVIVMLLLTTSVAVPLGSLVASLVPRDLEGALALLGIMAVQLLVDPADSWTRVLPLWSTRELASYVVEEAAGSEYLVKGVVHAVAYALALSAVGAVAGWWRLRTRPVPGVARRAPVRGA